jgi:hypothetical protein
VKIIEMRQLESSFKKRLDYAELLQQSEKCGNRLVLLRKQFILIFQISIG